MHLLVHYPNALNNRGQTRLNQGSEKSVLFCQVGGRYVLETSRMCISSKLESEVKLGLEPRHSLWDMGVPTGSLTSRPNTTPNVQMYQLSPTKRTLIIDIMRFRSLPQLPGVLCFCDFEEHRLNKYDSVISMS